jgi:signal transduction histidine kinase
VMRVQKQFLASMDKFVFFLDVRNKQKIAFFATKMILIFIFSFVILLTQIFFVFIPGYKKIEAQKTRLYDISFEVSHLLRKPVANVLGALNLIDDAELAEPDRRVVDIIRNETSQIDHIIREQSLNLEEEQLKL